VQRVCRNDSAVAPDPEHRHPDIFRTDIRANHMENRHIFNVLMAIRTVIGRSYGSSDGFLYGFSVFRAF